MSGPKRNRVRHALALIVAFGWLLYMHFGTDFTFVPPKPAAETTP